MERLGTILDVTDYLQQRYVVNYTFPAEPPWPRNIAKLEVMEAVCAEFGVSKLELRGRSRLKEIVLPRQVYFYLCSRLTKQGLAAIGRWCGDRDHTTVLWGLRKIAQRRAKERGLDAKLTRLETKLKGLT